MSLTSSTLHRHYYDWSGLLNTLNAAGIRMMTYINPYLANNVASLKKNYRRFVWGVGLHCLLSAEIRPGVGCCASARNLFLEAAEKGYLVKNSTGQPYILYSATKTFSFGTIDVTNPEAVEWFGQVIRCNMLYDRTAHCPNGSAIPSNATIGVGGWMSDFGEYLPFDSSVAVGDAATVHNQFVDVWSRHLFTWG